MEAAATEAEEKWLERREERACGLRPAGVEDGEDCENNKLKKIFIEMKKIEKKYINRQ